jgi:anthranilate synthase component 1
VAGRVTSRLGQTWPERDEFRQLTATATLVPVCRQILADLETPVSAFLKIHRGRYGFLLESVQGGERWGRYSFLGTEPGERAERARRSRSCGYAGHGRRGGAARRRAAGRAEIAAGCAAPAAVDGLPRFAGGAVGYLGYDVVRSIERLPATSPPTADPEARLMLATSLLVFDNVAQTITAVVHVPVGPGIDPDRAYDDGIAAWTSCSRA